MTTLAIDIGGTKLAAALIDKNLRISQRRELPTPASKTPDALREALKALVEPLRAEARQVAIASTGIIQEGMLLALNPHNLGGLLHFPLVQTLETIAGLPTLAVNDAQAAAWRSITRSLMISAIWYLSPFQPALAAALSATASSLPEKAVWPAPGTHSAPTRARMRLWTRWLRRGHRLWTRDGRGGAGRSGGMRRQNPIYSRWRRSSAGATSGKPIRAGNSANDRRCESDYRLPVCGHWRQRRVS